MKEAMKTAFGETIRRLRMEKGLTQQQLSDQLGLDRSSVASWELGRHMPGVTTITQLAEALGVETAALMATVEKLGDTPP